MQIHCPRCGRAIPGADIDLAGHTALCRPCGEVFGFAPVAPGAPPPGRLYRPVEMRWVEVPEPGRFTAVVRNARWLGAVFGLFALFWNGIVWTMALAVLLSGHVAPLAFMSLHLAAGLLVAYLAAVHLFNETRVVVDAGGLSVRRGPIPQPGRVTESLANIQDLAVVEGSGGAQGWGTFATPRRGGFGVSARTRDGRAVNLRLSFPDRAQAEYAAARLGQMVDDVRALVAEGAPYRGLRVDGPTAAARDGEPGAAAAAREPAWEEVEEVDDSRKGSAGRT